MRRLLIALLLLGVAAAWGEDLTFKSHGKAVATWPLDKLTASVTPVDVRVFDPAVKAERTFRGVPLKALLRKVYGDAWTPSDDIVFTCLDGYQPVLQGSYLAQHEAYLVWAMADGTPFVGNSVQLGPYYLVWDNLHDPSLSKTNPKEYPYQLTTLDLVSYHNRFPALVPPAGSSLEVQRGFAAYSIYCVACHTINGQGGTVGPELNYPVSVTQYWRSEYLRKWLNQPTAVRANAKMPPLAPGVPHRSRTIDDIIAYLQAMARRKSYER